MRRLRLSEPVVEQSVPLTPTARSPQHCHHHRLSSPPGRVVSQRPAPPRVGYLRDDPAAHVHRDHDAVSVVLWRRGLREWWPVCISSSTRLFRRWTYGPRPGSTYDGPRIINLTQILLYKLLLRKMFLLSLAAPRPPQLPPSLHIRPTTLVSFKQ